MTYNNAKNACGTYKKNEFTSLTPVQIVARLYLALDQDLVSAKNAITDGARSLAGEKMSHALAIIGELQTGLNFKEGGEIAANLGSLYLFIIAEISKSNLSNSPGGLINAIETVKPLSEAWEELAIKKRVNSIPKMGARSMATAGTVAFNATF